jgi:phosphoribosyl-AMP cyclohydrolase
VKQNGGACHEGYYSCFFRKIQENSGNLELVKEKVFEPENVYGEK